MPIRSFEGHTSGVHQVAFSTDGKTCASASEDKTVRIWDVATGKSTRVLQGHYKGVSTVAFSPDGVHVASGSYDGTIRVWNIQNGDLESVLERHAHGVQHVAYADQSHILSSGWDDTVRVWDPVTEKELRRFEAASSSGGAIAVSDDGRTALICGDKTVLLVNLETGQELRQFDYGEGTIGLLWFNPDHKRVMAFTSSPDKLFVWNKEDGSIVRQTNLPTPLNVPALSPDGKILIGSYREKSFIRCDPESGEFLQVLGGMSSYSWACAFSPDGRYLLGGCLGLRSNEGFIGGDTVLRLWDLHQP